MSRSDLRRELDNLGKAAMFEQHLDTFTIAAPSAVLKGWQDMPIPARWGVLSVADDSSTQYVRAPASTTSYADSTRPVDRAVFAALARSLATTAERQCSRHGDLDPRRKG